MRQDLPGDLRAEPPEPLRAEVETWDGPDASVTVHEWASYWDLAVDYWAVKAAWADDADAARMSPDHPADEYLDETLLDVRPHALTLVAALIEAAPSRGALAFAGAGWLEDLVRAPEFDDDALAWVAGRVSTSARWRYAASCVWLGDEPASRTAALRAMGAHLPSDPPPRLPEVGFVVG